ncbi:MAG: hypothetical protein ACK5JC_01195, partial [Bacteroidota bacterium]
MNFFNASGNSQLTCIQVDDPLYMNANWSSAKDAMASYSSNCSFVGEPDCNMPLSPTITGETDICFGNTTSLTASIDNYDYESTMYTWTGPYGFTFQNNHFNGGHTLMNISVPGLYTCTISNGEGCTATVSRSIRIKQVRPGTISTPSLSICPGQQITMQAPEGTSNHEWFFNYEPVSTLDTLVVSESGAYFLAYADSGCNFQTPILNIMMGGPVLNSGEPVSDLVICSPNTGESLVAEPGFTYQWFNTAQPGVSVSDCRELQPDSSGSYYYIATDRFGCTAQSASFSVTVFPGITGLDVLSTPSFCGNNTGQISVTGVRGGNPPFTYDLNNANNPQADGFFSNLLPNAWPLTVTDANGCKHQTMVSVPTAGANLSTSYTLLSEAGCNGASFGSFSVQVNSGGVAPFEYSLDQINFSSNNTFSNLPSGLYHVFVKDQSACITQVQGEIFIPESQVRPSVIVSNIVPSACGSNNGSLELSAEGNSPFSYSLDNGQTWNPGLTVSGLSPGNVQFMVRDGLLCESLPVSATVTSSGVSFSYTISSVPATCQAQGTLSINFSSGTAPFRIAVDGGAFTNSLTIGNLSPGTHTLLLGDASGCLVSDQVNISNQNISNDFSVTSTPADCDSPNGSIQLLFPPSSGTPPYTYSLDNVNFFPSGNFNNLAQGFYPYYVKDAVGCTANNGVYVYSNTVQDVYINVISYPTCENSGSLEVFTTYNQGNVFYRINEGYWQDTPLFTGLTGGSYYNIQATIDTNSSCIAQNSIYLYSGTQYLENGLVLIDTEPITCTENGRVNLSLQGIEGSVYVYINNFFSGYYTPQGNYLSIPVYEVGNGIDVYDVEFCKGSYIYVNVEGSQHIQSANVLTQNANCACYHSGSITLDNIQGGTAPFKMSVYENYYVEEGEYQNNGQNQQINQQLPVGISAQTSSFSQSTSTNVQGLAPNTYYVILTDAGGCSYSISNVYVGQDPSVYMNLSVLQPNYCGTQNGQIDVSINYADPSFQYSLDGISFQSSPTFSNLHPGSYQVYAKNEAGCEANSFASLDGGMGISQVIFDPIKPGCESSGGVALLNVIGGTPPYRISTDSLNFVLNDSIINLEPGTYRLIVKDAFDCVFSAGSFVLNPPEGIQFSTTINPSTCAGSSGSIEFINILGGNPPYFASIDSGLSYQPVSLFDSLAAGQYQIAIKDNGDCVKHDSVTILNIPVHPINLGADTAICSPSYVLAPGSSFNNFSWSDESNNDTLLVNVSGTYWLSAQDSNGCISSDTVVVTFNLPSNLSTTQTACGSFAWNDSVYTNSGTHIYHYLNVAGCPSADTLHLTINPIINTSDTVTACASYFWNDSTYTQSGLHLHNNGCGTDSLLLTINPITNTSDTVTACGNYFWNDSTYTESGLHLHSNGCGTDSLLLTINPITNTSDTVTACGSYFWNDSTYTESGLHLHNNGCGTDSLLLTITPVVNSSETVTACGNYFWNDSTYTESGLHLHNNGCGTDSLLLTITPVTNTTDTVTAFASYFGTDSTYTQSGLHLHSNGCGTDSLLLTITPITNSSDTVTACGSYLWND